MVVIATRSAYLCVAGRFSQTISALRAWWSRSLPPPPAVPAAAPVPHPHTDVSSLQPIAAFIPTAHALLAARAVLDTGYSCFLIPTSEGPQLVLNDSGPDFKTAIPA